MTETTIIARGSLWKMKGDEFDRTARVMGEIEGYIVWRFKGAAPQLLHRNDWREKFEEFTR